MINHSVDVLIIGGGLTGTALLHALKNQPITTLLVEACAMQEKSTLSFDNRCLALSQASVHMLDKLSVWPLLKSQAIPIETIDISEQYNLGKVILNSHTINNNKPFGFVVEIAKINQAFQQCLRSSNKLSLAKVTDLDLLKSIVTIDYQGQKQYINAKLIVAADGSHSFVRSLLNLETWQKNYHQHAIVANIGLKRGHKNCAYERFTAQGSLAMLPLSSSCTSLVWALPCKQANIYMNMSDKHFLSCLQIAFGYKLGRLQKVGQRVSYPLHQIIMPRTVAWPVVFIGNAAQTLHPIAGQGFNLGFRDVATLAQCINEQGLTPTMLNRYQDLRHYDKKSILKLTNILNLAFKPQFLGAKILRSLSLLAIDNINLLQNPLVRHAAGFAGMPADLICEPVLNTAPEEEFFSANL